MWSTLFGKLLRTTFDYCLIDVNDVIRHFASSQNIHLDNATISKWLNGNHLPTSANYSILNNYLSISAKKNSLSTDKEFMSNVLQVLRELGCHDFDILLRNPTEDYFLRILKQCRINFRSKNPKVKKKIIDSPIKTVVFDFDGTLTSKKIVRSTWENLWLALGYTINDCQQLHVRFSNGDFDHQTWCNFTAEKFITRGLKRSHLDSIVAEVKLIDDLEKVFKELQELGINIYIVSGSIKYIIKKALAQASNYVTDIHANGFDFDSNGYLTKIIGTDYDFKGKALFIKEICNTHDFLPENVLFVGNSNNDEFAHESGARTLCINPMLTNHTNTQIWHNYIKECSSLEDVLTIIKKTLINLN